MPEKKRDELVQIDYTPPRRDWMDPAIDFEARKGTWSYPAAAKNLRYLGFPNPRDWSPTDEDWQLPENWQQIIHDGLAERLTKYRSLKLFLDVCVRCGACADKCHFYLGSGDPKNMPVLRAELLRSVYRNDFTTAGKILGRVAGARKLTPAVLKEWFYYFYQCTECRRCSVFCPYGIDTAEITMIARELLNLVGLQHQLGHGAGRQLRPHRQPPRHPAAHLQGQHRVPGGRARGDDRDPRQPLDQPQGRRGAVRRALGRLLRRAGHLHLHGLPAAVARARARLHALAPTPRKAATSGCSPPTR